MIPTQTFENFPEFANAGEKTQPNEQKYAQGFLPSDTLPAEWHNWFLGGTTRGITALDTGLASVEAELNSVLTSRQESPDATKTNQLLTVLEKIKAEAILAAHPVGSLYWTSSSENPAVTFGGGTWKQIKDRFVIAAGDTYNEVDATGGSATVTLGITQIPAHTHGLNSHTHTLTPQGTVSSHNHGLNSHTHTVGAHSHGLNSHQHGMNHIHLFTPRGTVSSHSHGLNNHTHIVGAHVHGLNSHTHSFTPNGSVSVTTNPTFSGSAVTSGVNSRGHTHIVTASGEVESTFTGTEKTYRMEGGSHTHQIYTTTATSGTTIANWYGPRSSSGSQVCLNSNTSKGYYSTNYEGKNIILESGSLTVSGKITPEGNVSSSFSGSAVTSGAESQNHTHSVTASGTISGGAYSFSGTAGTTGAASGNTANSTVFNTGAASGNTANAQPTFSGTQGLVGESITTDSSTEMIYGRINTDAATGNTANSTVFNTGAASGNTANAQPTFSGTQGTTSAATGNTANATPTFSGTQGTTSAATGNTTSTGGSNGTTQAVTIMPPYVVKYCWERTA